MSGSMPTSVEARRVVPLPQLARAADALPGGAPTIGRRLASHGFLLGLLGVVLLAAALRVPGLADFPPGLLQDEAQIGYDAYSVLRTGRDHHGDPLPINFRSFNDYLPGLYFYLAMPTIALFGLEPVAVRLPAAILGLIAVVATGFAARRLAGTGPGLAAALFLAVSPYAIAYSRIGWPAALVPGLVIVGVAAHLGASAARAESRRRADSLAVLAGLAFGLAVWSYPVAKLFVPSLVAALALLWWRRSGRQVSVLLATFALVVLPFAVANILQWEEIQNRFSRISVVRTPDPIRAAVANYLVHFAPERLVWGGYVSAAQVLPPGTAQLLPIVAALAAMGVFVSLRRARQPEYALLLAWLVLFPAADALTRENVPNNTRSITMLPLPELLAAVGLGWLMSWLAIRCRTLAGTTAALAVVVAVASSEPFLHAYFVEPVQRIKDDFFHYRFGEAIRAASAINHDGRYGEVWVEPTHETYMFVLFYTARDPAAFHRQPADMRVGRDLWVHVSQMPGYRFGTAEPEDREVLYVCHTCPRNAPYRVLHREHYADGAIAWQVIALAPR